VCPDWRKSRHHGRISLYNIQTADTQRSGSCGWTGRFYRVFDRIAWSWIMRTESQVCFITTNTKKTLLHCGNFWVHSGRRRRERDWWAFPNASLLVCPSARNSDQMTYQFEETSYVKTTLNFVEALSSASYSSCHYLRGKNPELYTFYTKLNVSQSYFERSEKWTRLLKNERAITSSQLETL
jgi:hypothetical protein